MSLNLQYKVGITRQVIQALRKVYESPIFPDQEIAQKINIENEYPIIQERYPAIYINYNEQLLQDSGLGSFTLEADESGIVHLFRQWIFQGDIMFHIMALDPLERDTLIASLSDIFAFGKDTKEFQPFYEEIYDEEFVSLQLNHAFLTPAGQNVAPAPWGNADELVYIASYGANVLGSFYTEPNNSALIQISKVNPYPYTPDQPVPTGTPGQPNPFTPMGL